MKKQNPVAKPRNAKRKCSKRPASDVALSPSALLEARANLAYVLVLAKGNREMRNLVRLAANEFLPERETLALEEYVVR